MTIDKSDTYLAWVAPAEPSHWAAFSNNQVLNSLLMRLFTSVFGWSHLMVPVPALSGAAIHIATMYLVCLKLAPILHLQSPPLVWLVYNLFVFDYMVAARGYALALGFLLLTLAAAVYLKLGEARVISANFSMQL